MRCSKLQQTAAKLECGRLLANTAVLSLKDANDGTGGTTLSFWGYLDIAKVLVDHGADMDSQDEGEWIALTYATMGGHLDIAKILVDHGAGMDFHEKHGVTRRLVLNFEPALRERAHSEDEEAEEKDGGRSE